MSCREIERLFLEGAGEAERRGHRAACPTCEILARDAESGEVLTSRLAPPAWSASLREALLAIPSQTVDCDTAADLIARSVEGDAAAISARDVSRLAFHESRCDGCREAHHTLASVPDLAAPQAPPWLSTRLSASKPARPRSRWRGLMNPRLAIGAAYVLAVVVVLAGFNPADLVQRAGAGIRTETRSAAAVAGSSLADRVGALQDRVARQLAIWQGRAGGYGRAVLSNAIALVMRTDNASQPPSRPRNGDGRAVPRNENTSQTWHA
jgi:hypothetical protein